MKNFVEGGVVILAAAAVPEIVIIGNATVKR
jgi:hypothetical protein